MPVAVLSSPVAPVNPVTELDNSPVAPVRPVTKLNNSPVAPVKPVTELCKSPVDVSNKPVAVLNSTRSLAIVGSKKVSSIVTPAAPSLGQ